MICDINYIVFNLQYIRISVNAQDVLTVVMKVFYPSDMAYRTSAPYSSHFDTSSVYRYVGLARFQKTTRKLLAL